MPAAVDGGSGERARRSAVPSANRGCFASLGEWRMVQGLFLSPDLETENGRFPIWVNTKPSFRLGWCGMKTSPPPFADTSSLPVVRVLNTPEERAWFDAQLNESHDLGASRQVVEIGSKPLALLAFNALAS